LESSEVLSDRSRVTEVGILPLFDLKIAAPFHLSELTAQWLKEVEHGLPVGLYGRGAR
jgi:hypothetical protein